jgi:tetratricopeptide (TPR) repeat protein
MPAARAKRRTNPKERASNAAHKSGRRGWIFAAAAVAAVCLVFAVYGPALGAPFVFDDLRQPYYLEHYPGALLAWISGVRPALMLSYWSNYQLSKEVFGFHICNVIIHGLNAFLVFFIVGKLAAPGGTLAAAFAAAVFLVHPIQTESVTYIAGRSECLSALFFLGAFAVFLYRRPGGATWKVTIAVLALFGAALATKEHTLVLPGLLLLTDYYWNPGFSFEGIRRNWRVYVAMALAGAAGVAVVASVLTHAPTAGFGVRGQTWYQYFFTECRAFFVYLRLLIFPAGQNLDWDYPISRNIMDHGTIFAMAAILLLLTAAIYFRRRYPLASYGFLVYVLLLAPTSSFVPIKDPLAERRLYLPMIGMLLVVAAVTRRIRVDRRKLAAACACLVLVLAILTYQRNRLWASDTALWEDTVHKSPSKARVRLQLAFTYYAHGRCQDALAQYAEASQLRKPDVHMLVDWGLAYECAGEPDEALAKLREAAALRPTAHVFSQIGLVYARQSRWPEALEALNRAESLDRNYDMTYCYRAGVRAKTNDLAGALADYQHALALDPTNQLARQGLTYVEHLRKLR